MKGNNKMNRVYKAVSRHESGQYLMIWTKHREVWTWGYIPNKGWKYKLFPKNNSDEEIHELFERKAEANLFSSKFRRIEYHEIPESEVPAKVFVKEQKRSEREEESARNILVKEKAIQEYLKTIKVDH